VADPRVCGNCGASIRGVDLAGYVDFSVRLAALALRWVQLAESYDRAALQCDGRGYSVLGDQHRARAAACLGFVRDLAAAFPELDVGAATLARGIDEGAGR
jgi:hypothetical protein